MTRLESNLTKATLRRLHGEPQDSASTVDSTVDAERAEADRVERLWRALDPPPATEPPPDFASRTAAALRRRRVAGSWSVAPTWARAGAAAALAAGLLLGVGVGSRVAPHAGATSDRNVETMGQASDVAESEADWLPLDAEGWSEESWGEAWNDAFDASFGPADGS